MTDPETYKLGEVFGISRDVPENYVTRESVDTAFVDSLTRDQHIVIYGGSKQGKSCLRRYNVDEREYVVVTCSNRWDLGQLHAAILKAAGYRVEQSDARTVSGRNKISAQIEAGVNIASAKIDASGAAEKGDTEEQTVTTKKLELDPIDVNDIIAALKHNDFEEYIVLEDFHYLPEQTQKDFATGLKTFHEASGFTFIVVGVWLDENRLIQYNGDLTGRVVAINADAWSRRELEKVISEGERLLNVDFAGKFRSDLLEGCLGSVSVVQESCYQVCAGAGIFQTQDEKRHLAAETNAVEVIKSVVNRQSASYNAFIEGFAGGFKTAQPEMYRWLLLPVLAASSKELEDGLVYNAIRRTLIWSHPEGAGLNLDNLTQALQSVASLQVNLDIKPIIFDYDQSELRLNVVDRGFLIWLEHQDRPALLEHIGLPAAKG